MIATPGGAESSPPAIPDPPGMLRLEPTPRREFFRGMTLGWTAALALTLVAIATFSWLGSATGTSLTPCLLRQSTGLPCPLCGGTSAAKLLFKGKPGEALIANPLAVAAIFGAALYALAWLGFACRIRLRFAPPLALAAFLLALAANWAYVASQTPSPPTFLETRRAAHIADTSESPPEKP